MTQDNLDFRLSTFDLIGEPGPRRSLVLFLSAYSFLLCHRLDLYTNEQAAEVARLKGLGAERVVPWPYEPDSDSVVMADPDGNEFCVVQTDYTQGDPPGS